MTTKEKAVFSANKESRYSILQPLLGYRFRILFGYEKMTDIFSALTEQVICCNVDLLNNKLTIQLRQPAEEGFFRMVNGLIQKPYSIFIEPLSGGNESISTIEFHRCECTKASVEFDYAKSAVLTHDLEFKFSHMEEYQKFDWEKIAEENQEK